jgi:WD40 repeat protein
MRNIIQVDPIQTIDAHGGTITNIISISETEFATVAYDNTIKIWDSTKNFECAHAIPSLFNIRCLALTSIDRDLLVAGAAFGHLLLFSMEKKAYLKAINKAHEHTVWSTLSLGTFNNEILASQDKDTGVIRLWAVKGMNLTKMFSVEVITKKKKNDLMSYLSLVEIKRKIHTDNCVLLATAVGFKKEVRILNVNVQEGTSILQSKIKVSEEPTKVL